MRKRRFVCIILSIVICIFSLVPVSASADTVNPVSILTQYPGVSAGLPYTINSFSGFDKFDSYGVMDKYNSVVNNSCGYPCVYINFINTNSNTVTFYVFAFSSNISVTEITNGISVAFYGSVGGYYFGFNLDTNTCTSCCSFSSPLKLYTYSGSYDYIECYVSNNGATYVDDNFLFGFTGISDYTFLDALGNALVDGSPVLSQIDFIRNMFQNNFKNKTGITDDNELNDIMTATASGDFTVLDNYVSDSATKQSLIDSVSSMQSFYNDNFSYDSDNDTYTVLNYDPENNIYPSWYVTNVDIDSGGSGSGSTSVNGSNAFAYGYGGNSSSSVGDIIINNNIPETTTGGDSHISDDFNVDMSNFEVLLNECLNAFEFFKRGFSVFPDSIWICFSCLCTVCVVCRILGR